MADLCKFTNKSCAGTYKAEVLNRESNTWIQDSSLQVLITVEETFDNDHRVVSQRTPNNGRFTFTAADAGQHRICFTPDSQSQGWLSSAPYVKLGLDIAMGATSKIESEDSGKISDITQRVRDLNSRLEDIRREQVFQRVGYFHCIRLAASIASKLIMIHSL